MPSAADTEEAPVDLPDVPPYIRIAGEIRARVASGELRPGDRVPSTRQITERWGVAMATATKVLVTLRHEGVVRAVPGVGTVVAAPPRGPAEADARDPATAAERPPVRRRRPRGGEHDLTRERVVRTGIEVADAEGLAALSMRRLAAELGVATMSLYRHVPAKDELVVLMVDAVLAERPPPANSEAGWRERLETSARLLWETLRRHPWLAHVISFTRPLMAPNGLALQEWVLSGLSGLGLSPNAMLHASVTLCSYVHGVAVNLEWEAQAEEETGVTDDEWMESLGSDLAELFASGAFPTFTRVLAEPSVELDLDSLFEFGLRRMLDGMAVLVEGAGGSG